MAENPRHVGQGLHVVHDGRFPVKANGRRKIRGLDAGHPPVALQALDKRRLLAHDVGAGPPVEGDVHREGTAQHAAAHVARGIRLVQRGGNSLLGQGHLASHVQEALGQPERVASDETPLDQLVGVALHE